jgi:hypothetical protein
MIIQVLLTLSGVFTILLGTAHFFFPALLDFRTAIPRDGGPLKPFRLFFYRYQTQRSDVHGIAWLMNHSVSFVLITIGVLDLLSHRWLSQPWGWMLSLWIALWWFLRAACQLYLGTRRGDILTMIWFALLGLIHLAAL